MAITQVLARSTTYSVAFVATQDGAAGTTLIVANSDLLAGLAGIGGALRDLLTTDSTGNNQAIQRSILLGDANGIASQDLRNTPHCQVIITPRDAALGWAVDADVDAVSALRGELNITGPAGISSALIALEFRHTYDR